MLLVIGGATSARAADVVLTMPFENESGKAEFNWIGDSFAITLANLLDAPGMIAISPEERNLAYERLGLKSSDLLTRAAMIRIADAAQANLAVIGTFDIGGDAKKATIAIKARLVETREGRLVANKTFNLSGPLGKLQEMQGQLAWSILYERNPMLTYSKDQLIRRSTLTPPRAYESFVKGVQTPNPKLSENFLKRSILAITQRQHLAIVLRQAVDDRIELRITLIGHHLAAGRHTTVWQPGIAGARRAACERYLEIDLPLVGFRPMPANVRDVVEQHAPQPRE